MTKILAVSDPHVPKDAFSLALNSLGQEHEVPWVALTISKRPLVRLREFHRSKWKEYLGCSGRVIHIFLTLSGSFNRC